MTWTQTAPSSANWTTDATSGTWNAEEFLQYLLQENGDNLLDESGNSLLLESSITNSWEQQNPTATNWS